MNTRLLLPALLAASLANAQPAAPDVAPAKKDNPAAAAKTEMQKWIEATDAQWQAAFKRDVTDVREAEARKVMLQYITLLEDAIDKASKAGDLKGALALRDEQKRFGDTQLFPEKDDAADTAAAVKEIRTAIRAQLAKLETDAAVRTKALHAKYDEVLAQAQLQLTQAKRLDDALLVQTKRDEITAAWITPAIAKIAENKNPLSTQPASTAKPAIAKPSSPIVPAKPAAKGPFDDQMAKLTRGIWTWKTPTGQTTIKFSKDGTYVHTGFSGKFEFQTEDTVIVHMPTRAQILHFNFGKGEYFADDPVLKQHVTGRRK